MPEWKLSKPLQTGETTTNDTVSNVILTTLANKHHCRSSSSSSSSSSTSNFIPNRIQQNNTVYMTNITNNRVIIDIVMWFCWWPTEKPWAYHCQPDNLTKCPTTLLHKYVSHKYQQATQNLPMSHDQVKHCQADTREKLLPLGPHHVHV